MSRNSSSDNSVGIVVVDNSAADVTMLRKTSSSQMPLVCCTLFQRGREALNSFLTR